MGRIKMSDNKSNEKKEKSHKLGKSRKSENKKYDVLKGSKENIQEDIKENIDEKIYQDPTLTAPTVEREYAKANVNVKGDSTAEIPEPIISPPEIDLSKNNENNNSFYNELGGIDIGQEYENNNISNTLPPKLERESKYEYGSTAMPGMEDIDARTKRKAAEHLADVCISAYVELHELAKSYVKFDERKMQIKAVKGQFDFAVLNIELPLSEEGSETITVAQFIDSINQSADETFVVTEEFKNSVRPLLIKIFAKKGWGMTPEGQLLYIVAQDIVPKIQQMIIIKSYTRTILDISYKILQELKEKNKQAKITVITNENKKQENIEREIKDEIEVETINK